MDLIEKKLVDYINEVDSEAPTPGGGSVAALVGALGASLVKMLAHLSINKKKFLLASEKEKKQFILAVKEIEYYKSSLKDGVDEDAISYKAVMAAYKGKDPEEIQNALQSSAFVALEIETSAFNALKNVEKLIPLGNKNVISDLISGTILLVSCIEMTSLNVIANATLIEDQERKKYFLESSQQLIVKAKSIKNKILRLCK